MRLILDTHVLLWWLDDPSLPLLHRDPFDRMLVAQAIVESCVLVSRDAALTPYAVPLIVA